MPAARTDHQVRNAQKPSTERDLAESIERYRSLFAYSPHAAFSLDLDGNFTDANSTRRGGQRLLHRGLPADEVHRRDRAGAPAGVHRRLRGRPAPGAAADRGQHAAPGRQHHRAPGDRRTRGRARRRGRRARPRRGRHRAERAAPRARAHPPCRRGGQRGEDAVPGQHEPRGAYAADQRARSGRDPGRGRSRSERPGAGDDRPAQRREAAPPGQRHPRRLASRGRQARRPGDRDQPPGRGRRRDHLGRPAGAQGGADLHLGPRPHPARARVRRRHAHLPGAHQPARQRDEVHRPGRGPALRAAGGAARPRGRRPLHRRGLRDRHPDRADERGLRVVHPGRHLDHPEVRRRRARPRDLPGAGAPDGRHPRGEQRRGSRQHLRLHAARSRSHPSSPPESPARAESPARLADAPGSRSGGGGVSR